MSRNASTAEPIVVDPNPTAAMVWVAIRSLLFAAGGFFVGKGWVTQEVVEAVVGAVMVLGPAAYVLLKSRQNTAKLTRLASVAPNDVAQVKTDG